MEDEKIAVEHRWYRIPDGAVREEAWWRCGISQNLLFSIVHPRLPFVLWDSKATHAWWDGSCLVTALVKEGPKALALYKGGKA